GDHPGARQPFPSSVALETDDEPTVPDRAACIGGFGDEVEWLGVGVERVDYTKGLPERFHAIHRFFERWPEYRRRVVFVQIASPSRSRIPRYQRLQREIDDAVRSINDELGERGWRPIIYPQPHHAERKTGV